MHRRTVGLAWCALHFFLILAIAIYELCRLIAAGLTVIPGDSTIFWTRIEKAASIFAGQALPASNHARQALVGYLHSAGIEGAYGFFAPSVPANYKIAFEFRYHDGHVEEDLPSVQSYAAGLRLSSLLDQIGRSNSEQFRKVVVRMLTEASWERHPDAVSARAAFGILTLPDPAQFERGMRPRYQLLYGYDFSRNDLGNPAPR